MGAMGRPVSCDELPIMAQHDPWFRPDKAPGLAYKCSDVSVVPIGGQKECAGRQGLGAKPIATAQLPELAKRWAVIHHMAINTQNGRAQGRWHRSPVWALPLCRRLLSQLNRGGLQVALSCLGR